MPVRVELIEEAAQDLLRYAESGKLDLFLAKLVLIERAGKQAGQPLGGPLSGWRRIVVGDRDWRIIFTVNRAETVATVCVIGNRGDAECYEQATARVRELGSEHPVGESLAAIMLKLRRRGKRRKSKKKRRK